MSTSAIQTGKLGIQGYYSLANQPNRARDFERYQRQLLLEARKIREALLNLRQSKPSKPVTDEMKKRKLRATERFKPASIADQSTHLYSEKYDFYHQELQKAQQSDNTPFSPLFAGLPNAGNPKVSVGDVPTHAARYAYGLKPYAGHEEEVLEPGYSQTGKPKHPYSGMIYASVHPLTDYEEETGPSQLVDLQNKGRINLSQVIIPERETQFEGFVEQDRVKAKMKAKFPNFERKYLDVYAEKYGLDKELFDAFKEAFANTTPGTPQFTFIESSLSKLLAMHAELIAIKKADEAAQAENASLVYRTGTRSFGFMPPEIIKGDRQPTPSIPSPSNLKPQVEAGYGEVINTHDSRSEEHVPVNNEPEKKVLVDNEPKKKVEN